MDYFFIVKPISSQKKFVEFQEEFFQFQKEIQDSGGRVGEFFTSLEGENNARNLARKAVKNGFKRIIFVGGDGLINEGVNGIMEIFRGNISPGIALGIIPTGSGNNFAKALKIPKDIKIAFKIVRGGKTTPVDIGKVNEKYFVNCFSVGFDALINKIANDFKEKHAFLPKDLSYLFCALREIIVGIPKFPVRIQNEELNYQGRIVLAAITSSSTYGGIFKINPQASFNDGKLSLCLIEPVGKIRALQDLYKATKGVHIGLPEVKTFEFSSLSISSSGLLPCEVDGEILEPQKEFKISVLPKALKVIAP
ncbi:MAG: diacylglycerol kinase family protein [Patescibacteria group bacterium]